MHQPKVRFTVESSPDKRRWALRVWVERGPGLFNWSDVFFNVYPTAQAAHAVRRRKFPMAVAA